MNHKIQKIMQDYGFSPSHFADQIEVQRSTISHILVGRNKPSLEIIQKIKKRFPEVSYEWLIDDDSDLPLRVFDNNENTFIGGSPKQSPNISDKTYKTPENTSIKDLKRIGQESNNFVSENQYNPRGISNSKEGSVVSVPHLKPKTVEKVLVFYSDGTFSEYLNNEYIKMI